MTDTSLRIRALLDRRFELVAGLFVLLVLVGGWATYTAHVAPGTTTEERTVSSWRSTGTFAYNATVTRDTQVYSKGTVLKNKTTYFTAITPVLDGSYRFSYGASDNGSLDVTADAQLVVRSVSRRDGGNTTHWRYTRLLGSETARDVQPAETVSVPFAVNVSKAKNRSAEVRDELGASAGEVEAFVNVTVHMSGGVNGGRVERTRSYRLPLRFGVGIYQVPWDGPVTNEHRATRTAEMPKSYGPLPSVGGPVSLAVGLGSLAALVAGRRREYFHLSDRERERLAFDDDRVDFDEWITAIRLPDETLDGPEAEAASLQDLVDFAIDTDNAVIEDADRNAYFVFHDGVRYAYYPPELASGGAPSEDGVRTLLDKATEYRPTEDLEAEEPSEE